jgi:SAM-dependent methyltransferase
MIEQTITACEVALRAGNLELAAELVAEALRLAPGRAEIHALAGRVHRAEGRAKAALAQFRTALALTPEFSACWQEFSDCIRIARPLHLDAALIRQLDACLKMERIDTNGATLTAGEILLEQFARVTSTGGDVLQAIVTGWRTSPEGEALYDLLLTYLEGYRVLHLPLERAFTELRQRLLRTVMHRRVQPSPLALMAAMAVQCFRNEYVFFLTDWEREAVHGLSAELTHEGVDAAVVAAIAAYQPLGRLPNFEGVRAALDATGEPLVRRMLQVQVDEPTEERRVKKDIATLAPIEDLVSQQVRDQYEENPYPRWSRLPLGRGTRATIAGTVKKVLVAGCGTGEDPLKKAATEPQCEITALDLSLASLAYGARKAREYGIANVTFLHGDILDLAELPGKFDLVVCTGVLHHMREPERGLAAIAAAAVPGGLLQIALYTESGRQAIVAGIELRRELGLPPTPEGIRRFRQAVCALPAGHPARGLTDFGDFYSISECRDLVFHVQEHRFTLPRVDEMLTRAGLVFDSFEVTAPVLTKFRDMFPTAVDQKSLVCWDALEGRYPGIFGSMYQFLARKGSTAR